MAVINDVVVDCLFEENVQDALGSIGAGRLIMDDEGEPFLTPDGYLVVRLRDQDPIAFSRELERRVSSMRIVAVMERTSGTPGTNNIQAEVT